MTPLGKQQKFHKELKKLLSKYDAEICIEYFGSGYISNPKIVVDFDYDQSFFEDHGTGAIPQLILGVYERGE